MPTPRLMVILLAATGVVVAAVIALTLKSWWVFAAVLALHATATTLVIGYSLRRAGETGDKPDPVEEARIEEERRQGRPRAGFSS
jgi:membrane protein implicated in regulation of membrane protease activity